MLESLTLPDDVSFVRSTPDFDEGTVPPALRRAHRVASDVWGLVRVRAGTLVFVLEETGESRTLVEGDTQVIEPDALHHVELGADAVFCVEFHR